MAQVPTGEDIKRCGLCKEGEAKYKCPGCGMQTCSLHCSKGHKEISGCTGKRKQTGMVRMNEFDEAQLLSDIRFLEEVGRETDGAVRREPQRTTKMLPRHLKTLQNQASKRGIQLEFLSPGMLKRTQNSTWYSRHNHRISWHIEWHFVGASLHIHDKSCSETEFLEALLFKHVKPQRHGFKIDEKIKPYTDAGVDNLVILLKKSRYQVGKEQYDKLDPKCTLSSQLKGKSIFEFPMLLVLLPNELAAYKLTKEVSN